MSDTPTPLQTPPDANTAQRQAADPARSVWVSASAGTGKTKVLTDRVLGLLLTDTDPARILCLTFTKAAASEMSARIARRLSEWSVINEQALLKDLNDLLGATPTQDQLRDARRLFARMLDTPGGMKIQTLHAFCQSVLRRFPIEAALTPHFEAMDERSAAERLHEARERVLSQARAEVDPALAEALAVVTGRIGDEGFGDLLGHVLGERARLGALMRALGGMDAVAQAVHTHHGVTLDLTDTAILAEGTIEGRFDRDGLRAAAEALLGGSKTDQQRGTVISDWLANDDPGRLHTQDAYQRAYLTTKGDVRASLATKKITEAAPALVEVLQREAERQVTLEKRRRALSVARGTAALLRLAGAVISRYEIDKRRSGRLDYEDLILATRDLLTRPGIAPWVLYKLDGGLDHILIDEAQDTNPEQWQVVQTLAEEFFTGASAHEDREQPDPTAITRTLFAVGDVKQSIYSFQRAAPEAFLEMRRHFAERIQAAGGGWAQVALDVSFRSTDAVLATVDAVFARRPARDGVAERSSDGEGLDIRHRVHRLGHAGLVELWPVITPEEDEARAVWHPPTLWRRVDDPRARLAATIAERIRSWIDDGDVLPSRGRPIRAGDVLVLVRRRDEFVELLVRALKERAIEVAGIDRMVLTDQLAVMDLVALGQFVLLPEDDLTLATILKSPLIGFTEDDLLELAGDRRESRLWHELRRRAPEREIFTRAYGYLAELMAVADRAPPHEFFAAILSRCGRRRILERLGQQAADPLDEFLNQALAFERANLPSLQGFLRWLAASDFEIKRDLESGERDQVRIMTVHGAKGLQAPIVFLPDTTHKPTQLPRLQWSARADGTSLPVWIRSQDHDDAVAAAVRATAITKRDEEYRRLLYVAMTRAEDRLYVCGWAKDDRQADDCWHTLIRLGLGDLAEVIASDQDGEILRLVSDQTAELEKPDQDKAAKLPSDTLPGWARRPPDPEPTLTRPLTPSRPTDEDPPVRSPLSADDGARFRRGLILHRLLQSLPEVPAERRAEVCSTYLEKPVHGLTEEQQISYAKEVLAVLDMPEFAPCFAVGARAEVPIVGFVGASGAGGTGGAGGVVISGQIDRLVVTPERVLILDYKTNRPPPERVEDVPALYVRQMAAYRALLAEIYPDHSVDCALLWTDAPSIMILPKALLDRHAPILDVARSE